MSFAHTLFKLSSFLLFFLSLSASFSNFLLTLLKNGPNLTMVLLVLTRRSHCKLLLLFLFRFVLILLTFCYPFVFLVLFCYKCNIFHKVSKEMVHFSFSVPKRKVFFSTVDVTSQRSQRTIGEETIFLLPWKEFHCK